VNTPIHKLLLYVSMWCMFTPFVAYAPGFPGEYQPFFLLATVLSLAFSSQVAIAGSVTPSDLRRVKVSLAFVALWCLACGVEILASGRTGSGTLFFRFANLALLGFLVTSQGFVQAATQRRGVLFWVLVSYAVFGSLQFAGLLPANLPFVNRSTAEVSDLLDTGRGVPAFATEPSTFAGVVVATLVTHHLACHHTGKLTSKGILLTGAYCLFVLSKSTVFFIFFIAAGALALAPLAARHPFRSVASLAMLLLTGAALLPVAQPRTYELMEAILSSSDPGSLIEAAATLGTRSFSYRITPIVGVPHFLVQDLFSMRGDSCYPYLFLEFSCMEDASSITGLYVIGYSLPRALSALMFFWALARTLRSYRSNNPALTFWLWLSLLSFLHVSGNSPFFAIYFWLAFVLISPESRRPALSPAAP